MQNLISNTRLLDLGAPLPTIGDPSHFDSANLTDRAEVRRSSASSGSLVFIDSTVKNYQSLAAGAGAGQEIFSLTQPKMGLLRLALYCPIVLTLPASTSSLTAVRAV
ncbi:MAG: DUF4347 domain-containing protein [Leptolyngbyaceae cyanobacterium CSU_1_3]|nr:DUF4347 domain-containing protein [Leptolyngbyaceae cyanobacterium CSU_1_3]